MTLPKLARLSLVSLLAVTTVAACGVVADRRASERGERALADYPPTGRLIDVPGGRIHAETRGRGPDVVLIHGASGNLRDFTFAFADRLAGMGFRVTAFDRPGLGHSDSRGEGGISPFDQASALRAAARDLGITRPVLVGHSYGGAVAMAWALQHPSEVAAVVSLAGATMPWPGELGPWYRISGSGFGQAALLPLISAFAPASRADSAIAGIFAPDPVPDGYAQHIGAGLTLRTESLRANTLQVSRLKPFVTTMATGYPRLTLPVEIVHGTADRIVGIDIHARPMAQVLPNARLTVLEGVGHMPHHARPEDSAAAVLRAANRAGLR
jgi:pimeloyl-ACP methyl ester carboxylesterase